MIKVSSYNKYIFNKVVAIDVSKNVIKDRLLSFVESN
jgi:hypothetical protein